MPERLPRLLRSLCRQAYFAVHPTPQRQIILHLRNSLRLQVSELCCCTLFYAVTQSSLRCDKDVVGTRSENTADPDTRRRYGALGLVR